LPRQDGLVRLEKDMGWLSELLQGIPLNAVLKERVALAEQKFKDTEAENKQLKEKVATLTTEIEELKRRITKAPVAIEAPKETPTLKDGLYYKGDDGPFCTGCYDSATKLIRLIDGARDEQEIFGIRRKCPICKARYPN
jgi:hypothetical protein